MLLLEHLFNLGKVVLAFWILYVMVPSKVLRFDKDADTWMDRIFIPMVYSSLAVIIVVHILALFKIYESISFGLAVLFILIGIRQFRTLKAFVKNGETKSLLIRLLDAFEWSDSHFFYKLKSMVRSWLSAAKARLLRLMGYVVLHPFDGVLLIIPAAYGVYDRFCHAFSHFYYVYSDPYVHLTWMKYLGSNKLYVDGIYPYGYEALLSAVNKLFFIDPAIIIAYIGPLAGCMMLFSLYFFMRKTIKNKFIVFIVLAIYVISTELPTNILRQRAALPQEYAAIFFLPGIYYLDLYYRTDNRKYLLVAAQILALTIFIHLYAAMFVVIAYVFVSVIHIRRLANPKRLAGIAAYMSGAALLGALPILIALACGMKFHATSIAFIEKNVFAQQSLRWYEQIFKYTEQNSALYLMVLCSGVLICVGVGALFLSKKREIRNTMRLYIAVSFLCLFLYAQFRAAQLGFPAVVEYTRAGVFCAMIGVIVYGFFMSLVDYIPLHKIGRGTVHVMVGVYFILLLFNAENLPVLKNYRMEYDQAARIYYNVKHDFPALNWTIVSPTEQFAYSMGYGWHYNLWEFVAKIVEYPSDEFVFTTDYVFVMVEKIPLNARMPVTPEDAAKPFPAITAGYDEYYTNLQKRRIIEAKAYFWMEDYMAQHGGFTVYYEDDAFKVYMLKQDGTDPINLVAR